MSRYPVNSRQPSEAHLRLDIRQIARQASLNPGSTFNWRWTRNDEPVGNIDVAVQTDEVCLSYRTRTLGQDWQSLQCIVPVERTDCHLGGQRVWWLCPKCDRRVAVLFGSKTFACRHCQRISYPCQRETPLDRATRRADKIRSRLGWMPGILNPMELRPKGMHMATYCRLVTDYEQHVALSFAFIHARFGCGMLI